jgi:SAM-dependent methyltransferase
LSDAPRFVHHALSRKILPRMEYWESRFNTEGVMWKFEPSDSALLALEIFKKNHFNKVLIPGAGYGRNAKLFHDSGFDVTGIEISKSAISLAKANGLNFKIHHGSVTSMPFDDQIYDGIFCYALIHLLNKSERRLFLRSCYRQLTLGGLMIFVVASDQMSLFGSGRLLSKNRYEISKGLKVFFYDSDSVSNEFSEFGMTECKDIDEQVKFMEGQEPVKMKLVICRRIK